jgi:O-antigen/teichoic acid export membrane protein
VRLGFVRLFSSLDQHFQEVVRGASIAFLLKAVSAVLGFAFSVVVARVLGAGGSGVYFLAFTVATIAATIGRVGMEQPVVRFIAESVAIDGWGRVRGVYALGMGTCLVVSVALSLLIALNSAWISDNVFNEPALEEPLRLMCLAITPFALFTLQAHALRGLKQIRDAMLVLSVLASLVALVGTSFLASRYGVNGVVVSYVAGACVALGFGVWRWRRFLGARPPASRKYDFRRVMRTSAPLFWVNVCQLLMLRYSTILLGVHESSDQVGIFTIASRTAILMNFILIAFDSIAGPKFAELHKKGDHENLRKLVTNTSRIMGLAALVPLTMIVTFPKFIMGVFGPEFVGGHLVLVILSIGQFVNVSCGSVGSLLIMTGHERSWRNVVLPSVGVNVLLSMVLIPAFGMVGAAVSLAASLILQVTVAVVVAWRKLGILTLPTPFRVRR